MWCAEGKGGVALPFLGGPETSVTECCVVSCRIGCFVGFTGEKMGLETLFPFLEFLYSVVLMG